MLEALDQRRYGGVMGDGEESSKGNSEFGALRNCGNPFGIMYGPIFGGNKIVQKSKALNQANRACYLLVLVIDNYLRIRCLIDLVETPPYAPRC